MITKMTNVNKKTIDGKPITVIVNLSERIGGGDTPIHLHPGQRAAVQGVFTLPEIQIKRGVHVGKSVIAGNVRTEFNLPGQRKAHRNGIGNGTRHNHKDYNYYFHVTNIITGLNLSSKMSRSRSREMTDIKQINATLGDIWR